MAPVAEGARQDRRARLVGEPCRRCGALRDVAASPCGMCPRGAWRLRRHRDDAGEVATSVVTIAALLALILLIALFVHAHS